MPRSACLRLLLWVTLGAVPLPAQAPRGPLPEALRSALAGRPGTAVVMEVESGRLLAAADLDRAARRLAAPGSTVKPFVLQALLESGALAARTQIACPRRLVVAAHRLDCSHPAVAPLDATHALAYSCNFYFATAAQRLNNADLRNALQRAGFDSPTGLAPQEARGHVHLPASVADRQLLALGEEGIEVTPLALLAAYRRLALQQRHGDAAAAMRVVFAGLAASVEFGMALPVRTPQIAVAGKTGTSSAGDGQTHGWFVGYAPASQPEVAVVVYLERGNGRDAAAAAQKIFTAYAAQRRPR